MKENFMRYSLHQAEERLIGLGFPKYRAEQVFKWIWQKNAGEFSVMTNISKELRGYFNDRFVIAGVKIAGLQCEGTDAEKYLLELEDGVNVESVYIREGGRRTICVSCQAGCPLACKFCATGLIGLKRSLHAYEIADQVRTIQEKRGEKCSNVVFMGMGEPFINYDAVFGALEIMSSPIGLGIGRRHTTVSTVGIVEGIEALLKSSIRVKLAISLNFADEEMRQEFMPVARTNPLKDILKLAKTYSLKKEMVTFEYVIIKDINDSIRDARKLMVLLRNIPSKINLIPYNEHPRLPYRRPSEKSIDAFFTYLLESHHTVVIRKSRGQRILAACGQLSGAKAGII
ncbi:MAG: 23S rRNA (adenine(2503)-C(2))-methyltransferase RlmN [candidate division WOR-3 bacterium]|nr:MAG: 23S rRNA (adenine(2503)-C(2))-methyltransferase RlmN [candidate division WOR-3 bacterium]